MPKKPDTEATLAELEAEFMELAVQVDMASARRAELERLIKNRKRMASAKAKVLGMDTLEKEALKSALNES